MKHAVLWLTLSLCLVAGCRKSRPTLPTPTPEPSEPVAPTAPPPAGAAPTGAPAAPTPPPVSIPLLEAGVEFADLNNLVAGYYEKHKRLPTVPELTKMYYQPIPVPAGYKLVIDPKTKKVKAVR